MTKVIAYSSCSYVHVKLMSTRSWYKWNFSFFSAQSMHCMPTVYMSCTEPSLLTTHSLTVWYLTVTALSFISIRCLWCWCCIGLRILCNYMFVLFIWFHFLPFFLRSFFSTSTLSFSSLCLTFAAYVSMYFNL